MKKYKEEKISLNRTDLRGLALKKRRLSDGLKQIHSQVVQNVADRVSTVFKNFFERRARFPKNKHFKKYRSFIYPQSGFRIEPTNTTNDGHKLYLSRIGKVRIFVHRQMIGRVNRMCVKRDAGEWYAIFLIEHQNAEKKPILNSIPDERIRGGDLGLKKFITLDNEESEEYPKFLRLSEKKIKSLQRKLARKIVKGSKRYRALDFRLTKLHLHIKRQREDYQNKLVFTLFNNKDTDVHVLEKLSIENMLKNHSLAKSITDASFGKFARKCIYKAKMLGKYMLFVDPWGTTQFCYSCLEWVPKDLGEREHNCPICRIKISRDLNSGRLIRRLGILLQRRMSPAPDGSSSLAEPKPLPSLRGMLVASQGIEAGSLRLQS